MLYNSTPSYFLLPESCNRLSNKPMFHEAESARNPADPEQCTTAFGSMMIHHLCYLNGNMLRLIPGWLERFGVNNTIQCFFFSSANYLKVKYGTLSIKYCCYFRWCRKPTSIVRGCDAGILGLQIAMKDHCCQCCMEIVEILCLGLTPSSLQCRGRRRCWQRYGKTFLAGWCWLRIIFSRG